jgi:hypothetical protein
VSVHDAHAFLQISSDGGKFGHGTGLGLRLLLTRRGRRFV